VTLLLPTVRRITRNTEVSGRRRHSGCVDASGNRDGAHHGISCWDSEPSISYSCCCSTDSGEQPSTGL